MEKEEEVYQGLEVRGFGGIAKPTNAVNSRTIDGYSIVFNVESQRMYDWRNDAYFVEIIKPEALSEELLRNSDVKALMEHNRERLLARSNKCKGSLELIIEEKGLKYRFEAPQTANGDEALELVRRGDICGSSFAFRTKGKDSVHKYWDEKRQIWVHEIRKISELFDVSLTADPAYLQTSVDVRSLAPPTSESEEAKDEVGEEEKRAKEQEELNKRISRVNMYL